MKLSLLLASVSGHFSERKCLILLNQLFLERFDMQWEDLYREMKLCEKLYDIYDYRYYRTHEETDLLFCPLLEGIETTAQHLVYRKFSRKTGMKPFNCNK